MSDNRIEVELGFTKSMGEKTYEFIRVDIRQGYTLGDGEDFEEAKQYLNEVTTKIYENIEGQLVEKVRELDNSLGDRAKSSKIHAR